MPQATTTAQRATPIPAKAKPNTKKNFVERMANGKPFDWLKVESTQTAPK